MKKKKNPETYRLIIHIYARPGITDEQLSAAIHRDHQNNGNKRVKRQAVVLQNLEIAYRVRRNAKGPFQWYPLFDSYLAAQRRYKRLRGKK